MTSPVALITGGGSGIGRACVDRFSAGGYRIASVDLEPGTAALAFTGDVRDPRTADAAVTRTIGQLGRLDVLVTCAGLSRDAPTARMSDEDWTDVLDVDLSGTFYFLRAAARVMREAGHGAIVTVSSTLARRARRHLANYVAAKAGVEGLTRAAARDLGAHGVRVNGVAPGIVRTRLLEAIPAAVQERLLEETPLRRFAEPADVAEVIWFLASDAARHITGEVVRVDGGMLS